MEGEVRLDEAGAEFPAVDLETDVTVIEEIGNRSGSFAAIVAFIAHRKDEITEGQIPWSGFVRLFHNNLPLGMENRDNLGDATAGGATAVGEADLAAFEKICHGSSGFAGIVADAGNGKNEVAEGQAACGGFEGLFHVLVGLKLALGIDKVFWSRGRAIQAFCLNIYEFCGLFPVWYKDGGVLKAAGDSGDVLGLMSF